MPAREKGITKPSAAYFEKRGMLEKMRDVYRGNAALRAGGETYCPRFAIENNLIYLARTKNLAIPNYLKSAIEGFVGRIFSKPSTLGDDASEELREVWWEDLDRKGNKADVVFRELLTLAIRDGMSWAFIDMPVNYATNYQEEKDLNIRPYVVIYRDIDVIFARQDERGRIVDFRVTEVRTKVNEATLEEEVEKVYRRYIPGECQIFTDEGELVEVIPNDFPVEFGVPVVPFEADASYNNNFYTTSPLSDMADLIIRLWQSRSEQDCALHIARSPVLFGKMLGEKIETISPNLAILADNPEASLEWVEHSGKAINAGLDDIKELKAEIEAEGLKPLLPTVQRTATETDSQDARAEAPLKNIADKAHDAIENILRFMEIWQTGADAEGASVTLNSNFDEPDLSSVSVKAIENLYATNCITRKTYLSEMQRRGILAEGLDITEELEAVKAEDRVI